MSARTENMSHVSSRRRTFAAAPTTASLLGLLLLLCLFSVPMCSAHMVMSEPPPINYKTNPHYNVAKSDFDYTAPLSPSGSNYPCRGHLKDLNTPEGASVRDYAPGGTYDLRIDGGAAHGGGSCQVSLSFDGGVSYTVIKSFIGDCPHASGGGAFKFTIPQGTPAGTAIFAWTWFNQIGNREMYMNCAVVTITGGSSRIKRALSGPAVFVANLGNGCTTTAGTDVVFPDAGGDVEFSGDPGKRADPAGTCSGKQFTGGGATGGGAGEGTGTGTGTTGGGGGGTTVVTGGEIPEATTIREATTILETVTATEPFFRTETTIIGGGFVTRTQTIVTTGVFTRTRTAGGGTLPTPSPSPGGETPTIVDEGADGQSCDYWRKQGYICSAGPPTIKPMGNSIWLLVLGWLGLGFVWGLV